MNKTLSNIVRVNCPHCGCPKFFSALRALPAVTTCANKGLAPHVDDEHGVPLPGCERSFAPSDVLTAVTVC